jgi:hypothetical protein
VPLLLLPLFTQTERPVEHDVTPFSHPLPVLQAWFGVQAPHTPELQYMLVPHDWPLLLAAMAHVPPTPEQAWHAGHDELEQQMESTQLPLEHSLPPPQLEPSVFLGTHEVPLQRYPSAHWESEEQLVLLQTEASAQRTPPGQAWDFAVVHAPAPLQTRVLSVLPLQLVPQVPCGSIPFETDAHVPSFLPVSAFVQALQPLQALSQQTPSAHWPPVHSAPLLQSSP